ncbi:hypothetical protein G5S34_04470 [Herbaspirillum frisingense]|uniref:hypothetical protein n=1 Tax=Herbaspirillum frisingense TaxID=92645 RepID=UPI001602521C|nr:hypothetical protein [Herbaspirillum frisingense]QNB06100.1 hypothetical protein G5S34_04470 [Herbaspirillum frisingense]
MKKLMFAAVALGMVASSAFAGTTLKIDPSTVTAIIGTVTVTAPTSISGSFTPNALVAGQHADSESLGTMTATTTDGTSYAVEGDVSAKDFNDSHNSWTAYGTNDNTHAIKVWMNTDNREEAGGYYSNDGHLWYKIPSGSSVAIELSGEQKIVADTYTINFNVAKFAK